MLKKKTFIKEAQKEFADKTGFIYPWQFKGFKTISLTYNGLLTDLETYWSQKAQYREGFEYTDSTITIPNFFCKITGYKKGYEKYLKQFINQPNTIVFKTVKEFEETLNTVKISDLEFTLSFLENKGFRSLVSRIKDLSNFVSEEEEYRFCNVSKNNRKNFENALDYISNTVKLDFCEFSNNKKFENVCVSLNDIYLSALNNFDYSQDVPKIIIKEQPNERLSSLDCLWLSFLNELCFDILICSPSGVNDIETFLDINSFSIGNNHLNYKEKETKEVNFKKTTEIIKNKFIKIPKLIINLMPWIFIMISVTNTLYCFLTGKKYWVLAIVINIFLATFVSWEDDYVDKFDSSEFCDTGFFSGFVIGVLSLFIWGGIFLYSLVDSPVETKDGYLKIQNEIIVEDDYYLSFEDTFYTYEDSDYLYGYVGNPGENKKNCKVSLKLGNEVFATYYTLEPLEYQAVNNYDIELPEGETKAIISYEFFDKDETYERLEEEEIHRIEKEITIIKTEENKIPKEILERAEEE